MDDAGCLRALFAVGVDVAHDVVTDDLFAGAGDVIVDIVGMCLHLVDHLVGDAIDAEFLLGLREGDPELPPGTELVVLGEDELHFLAGVPLGKRTYVCVCNIGHNLVSSEKSLANIAPLFGAIFGAAALITGWPITAAALLLNYLWQISHRPLVRYFRGGPYHWPANNDRRVAPELSLANIAPPFGAIFSRRPLSLAG